MRRKPDSVKGLRFGKLLVLEEVKTGRHVMCQCKCDCGTIKTIRRSHLTSGNTVSCGCKRHPNYKGKRFGRLKALKKVVKDSRAYYECECDCGNTVTARGDALTSGATRSCGCLNTEVDSDTHSTHGDSETRLYRIYHKMRDRCLNPNSNRYDRYGGRGITICPEWLDSYEAFKNWSLDNGYSDDKSIDRKDNDKGYYPSNCRWVDNTTQANNTSRNILIEYKGEVKTLSKWCEELNYPYKSTRQLLGRGRTVEEVFTRLRIGKGFQGTSAKEDTNGKK